MNNINERVDDSSLDQLKKDFIKWNSEAQRIYMLNNFIKLQEYEESIHKQIWEFDEEEVFSFFKIIRGSGRLNMKKWINSYLKYCNILNVCSLNCSAYTLKANEILKAISDDEDRWISPEQYEKILKIIDDSSLDPIYDKALVLLYYLGVGTKDILKTKTSNIIDNRLVVGKLSIGISDKEKELLIQASNLKVYHSIRNLEKELLTNDPTRIIKVSKVYANEKFESQSYTHRVNTRIRKMIKEVDDELGNLFSGANLKFSGLLNKVLYDCNEEGLDILTDMTMVGTFPNSLQYERVIRRYSKMNPREFKMRYSGILEYLKNNGK